MLSGAVLLHGAARLKQARHGTALQSHTYAASSARALSNATALLEQLPSWRPRARAIGDALRPVLAELAARSGGAIIAHGQGAMWGGIFAHAEPHQCARANLHFKRLCAERTLLPYFIPVGGFMLTPRYDDSPAELAAAVAEMAECALATVREMGWTADELLPVASPAPVPRPPPLARGALGKSVVAFKAEVARSARVAAVCTALGFGLGLVVMRRAT